MGKIEYYLRATIKAHLSLTNSSRRIHLNGWTKHFWENDTYAVALFEFLCNNFHFVKYEKHGGPKLKTINVFKKSSLVFVEELA